MPQLKVKVDYVQVASLSIFLPMTHSGEEGVKNHIDFFQKTDTDILKIMNEHLLPYAGSIRAPEDWKIIKTFSPHDDFVELQGEFTKKILDEADDDAFTLGTLHGVVASGIHVTKARYGTIGSRELMCNSYRENKVAVSDAFKRMAEAQCFVARKYAELGVDGVFYAALGGEKRYFTDEEFEELIAPLDKLILSEIKKAGCYSFLHICKDHLNMQRYADYANLSDVVNWGVYTAPFPLEDGRKMFKGCTVMGGLENRSGVLVDGSEAGIKAKVKEILKTFGTKKFILGADCTLPTEISYDRIHAAVMAVR